MYKMQEGDVKFPDLMFERKDIRSTFDCDSLLRRDVKLESGISLQMLRRRQTMCMN